MVRFGSIRISSPLSSEHISRVGLGLVLSRSVSGFGSRVNFATSSSNQSANIIYFGVYTRLSLFKLHANENYSLQQTLNFVPALLV